MKRLFVHIGLFSALLLTVLACKGITPEPEEETGEIVFRFIEKEMEEGSKAALISSTSDMEDIYGGLGFGVFAYQFAGGWNDGCTPNFLYDEAVTLNGEYWCAGVSPLWPGSSQNLRFFAYAPLHTAGLALPERTAGGVPVLNFTVPEALSDQTDLLLAESGVISGRKHDAVDLTFGHALTAIRFEVASPSRSGRINRITLSGLYGSGSVPMDIGYWTAASQPWTVSGSPTASYTAEIGVDHTANDSGVPTSLYPEPLNDIFLCIPQTLPADAKLTISFTPVGRSEEIFETSLADLVLPWGNLLTITLNINNVGTDLDLTLQLQPWEYHEFTYAEVVTPRLEWSGSRLKVDQEHGLVKMDNYAFASCRFSFGSGERWKATIVGNDDFTFCAPDGTPYFDSVTLPDGTTYKAPRTTAEGTLSYEPDGTPVPVTFHLAVTDISTLLTHEAVLRFYLQTRDGNWQLVRMTTPEEGWGDDVYECKLVQNYKQ